MGKKKNEYLYSAYEQDGKWIGFVYQDSRLTVEEETKEQAIAEIRKTHNELLQDMRKWQEL